MEDKESPGKTITLWKKNWKAIIQLAIIGCDCMIAKPSTSDDESIVLSRIKVDLKEKLEHWNE